MGDLEVRLKFKKDETDDWTRVEDKVLRKKIQNRLAKRKSRTTALKRRPLRKSSAVTQSPKSVTKSIDSRDNAVSTDGSERSVTMTSIQQHNEHRKEMIRTYLAGQGLAEHRLISLPQYSLLRAFVQNAELLAIPFHLFADDDSLSPWTLSHPYPALGPHTLGPTALQLCTPHHPFVDVIASPALRDRVVLEIVDGENEDEFCINMHTETFTVWGSQPWNAMAWEVSQTFASKWAWLLDDETVRSSNFWRMERGEGPLVMPNIETRMLEEVV